MPLTGCIMRRIKRGSHLVGPPIRLPAPLEHRPETEQEGRTHEKPGRHRNPVGALGGGHLPLGGGRSAVGGARLLQPKSFLPRALLVLATEPVAGERRLLVAQAFLWELN